MRKIFAYFLTALVVTACTSEENFIEKEVQELPLDGVYVSIENQNSNIPGSRSTLIYDKFGEAAPVFDWQDDHLLVFPHQSNHLSTIEFKQRTGQSGASTRVFEPVTNTVLPLAGGQQYVAFYLNNKSKSDFSGYDIPVTYRGQKQTGHVDMRHYFDTKTAMTATTGADNYKAYKESEEAASAHLAKFDYLCSDPATAFDRGGIKFTISHMGAVVRFYIKCPAVDLVYTDLQLYNESVKFTLDANINVDAKSMTVASNEDATSHVITLKFQEGEGGENGFYIPEGSRDAQGNILSPFFDYYNGKFTAYLIAYMMVAPIDLSAETTKQSELYLIAHEKSNPTRKHYYKATLSTKPDLTAGKFFQWSPTSVDDQPIEFVETTVQDWEQANGIDNGNGNGTSGW